MKIINPKFEFVNTPDSEQILNTIETAYRICYKSESNGNRNDFISSKIKAGHESPLEHASISVIITTNRAVANEIVRHRVASYSQESTRYCNYSKDRFNGEVVFIRPSWCSLDVLGKDVEPNSRKFTPYENIWLSSCKNAEYDYLTALKQGATPQQARNVLNNSLATRIMVTMNIREWRHFFKLRAVGTTGKPHPEMLQITVPMLESFKKTVPVVFSDLQTKQEKLQ